LSFAEEQAKLRQRLLLEEAGLLREAIWSEGKDWEKKINRMGK